MILFPVLIAFLLCLPVAAQPPELDDWGDDLDLTVLRTPKPTPSPEAPDDDAAPPAPPAHLFSGFDRAPDIPEPEEGRFEDIEGADIQLLTLPAAHWLVAPNAERIDRAYARLSGAVRKMELRTAFPLKVVLHADRNFSVAAALKDRVSGTLPLGTDLSPRPQLRLVGLWADIQVARRDHPLTIQAFVALRRQAEKHGLDLDGAELFFLPIEPGRVFLAVRRAASPNPTP